MAEDKIIDKPIEKKKKEKVEVGIPEKEPTREPFQFDDTKTWLFQLMGMIETVTSIPSHTPTNFEGQVKIYIDDLASPTTKRFYIYSNKTNSWHYIALT